MLKEFVLIGGEADGRRYELNVAEDGVPPSDLMLPVYMPASRVRYDWTAWANDAIVEVIRYNRMELYGGKHIHYVYLYDGLPSVELLPLLLKGYHEK